jgi:hypothetical protein
MIGDPLPINTVQGNWAAGSSLHEDLHCIMHEQVKPLLIRPSRPFRLFELVTEVGEFTTMQRPSHPTAYRGVYLPLPHPERPNAADFPLDGTQ